MFQQIQKYERGANRVSASMLSRAAKALSCRVADIFPTGEERWQPSQSVGVVAGGHELTDLFLRMSPAQRKLLLGMAREFAQLGHF